MHSTRIFAAAAFFGFTAALPGKILERQVTATVTAEAHPLTFWPLSTLAATATALSYGSPPSPSRVPPGAHSQNSAVVDAKLKDPGSSISVSLGSSSSSTVTASSADTTTLCTTIHGSYPESTLPAFCRPSGFVNAPELATPTGTQAALPTAVVTLSANSVPDKVSCCGECANYFNCFAWRFVPSYVGTPTDRLPGGFDPWRHGNCEIAYYTGNTTQDGVTTDCAASICPNGRLLGMLNGTNNHQQDRWEDGLYYNGWNEGACGDAGNIVFQKGKDSGIGDVGALCSA
ncbi:hypothetical protein F5Y19DRAFT_77308 [Xylariaceae sp. FL1651]|nr:hypothetical protein F5Y19DRAFT_77308 [Xylariaceae sp. FL1651]